MRSAREVVEPIADSIDVFDVHEVHPLCVKGAILTCVAARSSGAQAAGRAQANAVHAAGAGSRMLQIVTVAHLVVWIALLALAGQLVLGVLAGARREGNFFYKLLETVASPFVKLTRRIAPRAVVDRHVPLLTLVVLGVAVVLLSIARIGLCLESGVNACA